MKARIFIKDGASPALKLVTDQLEDMSPLNASIATEAEKQTRDYIIGIAAKRHKTANRLGASPTGALANTAGQVTSSSDGEKALVEVPSFMFRRAFEGYWIVPQRAKFLTLPIAKEAYGKRVSELVGQGWKVFRPLKKGAKASGNRLGGKRRSAFFSSADRMQVLMGSKDGQTKALYSLKLAVFHEQDRSLLPSDEQYQQAALKGALLYVTTLIK